MRAIRSARLAAGAFLLSCSLPAAAVQLRVAAERSDGSCPAGGKVLSIARLEKSAPAAEAGPSCLVLFAVRDLSDAALDGAASRLSRLPAVFGVVLDFSPVPGAASDERLPLAVKKLSSAARSVAPPPLVALELPAGPATLPADSGLSAYVDAVAARPGTAPAVPEDVHEAWILASRSEKGTAAGDVVRAFSEPVFAGTSFGLVALLADERRPLSDADAKSLERLQAYFTRDVSRDPTPTSARRADGTSFDVARFFDAKRFLPILLLPDNASGAAEITLSGGPFAAASVENLQSGAKRDFELKGSGRLTLDLSRGALAAALRPVERKGGETKAAVEVGGARGLSVEEIVAKERAWDAGQRERVATFLADTKASLRFRIGEVNETFDLTILGPFFFRRGEPADWEWDQFYVNGVKWKGTTLPKLPILQPEKVTTLPLDIRLTEDYDYALKGEGHVGGRAGGS